MKVSTKLGRPELTGSTTIGVPSIPVDPTFYIGVVHAADGVRFTAVATSRHELVKKLARYVRRWGGYLLRPEHARHLQALLVRGESEAAIDLYFACVGKRWDKEWLVTLVTRDGGTDVAGVLGEVVVPEAVATDEPLDITCEREIA